LLLPYRSHAGDTTYAIEGWPVAAALVLLAVTTVLLAFAIPSVFPPAATVRHRVLGALGLCAGAAFLASPRLLVGLRAKTPDAPAALFATPMFVERAAFILALVAAAAGVTIIVRARSPRPIALACITAVVASIPLLVHSRAVERVLVVPHGAVAGAPHMHVGKTRALEARLLYADGSEARSHEFAVTVTPDRVTGDKPGKRDVIVRGVSPVVSFETKASLTVAEPRSSAVFPLVLGSKNVYRGERVCTYEKGDTRSTQDEETLEIAEAKTPEKDGLSVFAVRRGGGWSFEAYAADGETYWLPDDASRPVVPVVTWDRKTPACTLAPWNLEAQCRTSPERVERIVVKSGTDKVGQVVGGILTLGLWVPERSSCRADLEWVSVTSP
jgi:hypothetical protein